jgi:hypothetical protein
LGSHAIGEILGSIPNTTGKDGNVYPNISQAGRWVDGKITNKKHQRCVGRGGILTKAI